VKINFATKKVSYEIDIQGSFLFEKRWKSHSILTLLATQNYPLWLKYDYPLWLKYDCPLWLK